FIYPLNLFEHSQPASDARARFQFVAARNRRAKDDHQTVADVLVDVTAVGRDDLVHATEVFVQPRDDNFRTDRFGERGEAAYVREDDRDRAPLAAEMQ